MANPAIKWTPKASDYGTSEQTATFPRGLTSFRGLRQTTGNTAISVGGTAVSVAFDAYDDFEMELRGISLATDDDFFARITAWWAHASQGGEFKFFLDADNTLDTTTSNLSTTPQGDTTIPVNSTASLAVGDWILIEHLTDPTIWERAKVSSLAIGTQVTLEQGLAYRYVQGSAFRHAEYFPKCVSLQQASPLVERDGGSGNRWDFPADVQERPLMVYAPNATWTSKAAESVQFPVYFLRIDGLTGQDFSTHPVQSAATTKTVLMNPPRGGSVELDILDGTRTTQVVECDLIDESDAITALLATDAPGADLSSLVNRKATIYGGYKSMAEADYPAIFTGRIQGARLAPDLLTYTLQLVDFSFLLDGKIMTDSTTSDTTQSGTTTISGNAVNVYWSILTGVFSTGHGTFPLDSVSSAGTSSSAPTGLGIAEASIDSTGFVNARDQWHPNTIATAAFQRPTSARSYLRDEFWRVLQAWPAFTQDGLLSLEFHVPSLPSASAPTITEDDVVEVIGWERQHKDHLNKFTYAGDYSVSANTFDATLYNTETAEDTADQSATGETIELEVDSKWLRTDGIGPDGTTGNDVATIMAARHRLRYLATPVVVDLGLTFKKRALEEGDVVLVTHSGLPNMREGTRGLTSYPMTVIGLAPDFAAGFIRCRLIDTGYERFGLVGYSTISDYSAASDADKNTYVFISSASGTFTDGTMGYKLA